MTTQALEGGLGVADVKLVANAIRHDVIHMLEVSKSGHPGGSLSATDVLATLFFSGAMDFDAANPADHTRDRFFLSKGHAAPGLYAAFHQLGWLEDADMDTLRQLGSKLQGHPDNHACPGLEICSGSLGQGLSVAAGAALGMKIDAERAGVAPHRVYVLCGDGEMQEGSNWEALMFAAHMGLDNLTMLLDLNNLQIDGHVTDVCSLGDIYGKLAAFGCDVQAIDGHSVEAIEGAIAKAKDVKGRPQAIVCTTVKGKGVSFMEDQQGWHGVAPTHEQAVQAMAELDQERDLLLKEAHNG